MKRTHSSLLWKYTSMQLSICFSVSKERFKSVRHLWTAFKNIPINILFKRAFLSFWCPTSATLLRKHFFMTTPRILNCSYKWFKLNNNIDNGMFRFNHYSTQPVHVWNTLVIGNITVNYVIIMQQLWDKNEQHKFSKQCLPFGRQWISLITMVCIGTYFKDFPFV